MLSPSSALVERRQPLRPERG